MAQRVGSPAGGRAVDRVDPAQRAAGHDVFDLFVMLAVAVLMADHGFHARRVERLFDRNAFGTAHRDRFLKGD